MMIIILLFFVGLTNQKAYSSTHLDFLPKGTNSIQISYLSVTDYEN